MKKIRKSPPPNPLTQYAANHPAETWNSGFRMHNGGADYRQLKGIILNDQGGLCAYCETQISAQSVEKQRIEHFHCKSDTTNPAHNWALDWNNVIGVCLGGSDTDKKVHPLPDNLSCDAYKDYLIQKQKLPKACEGYYINPLHLFATSSLFEFDKATGELKPNNSVCQSWQIEESHYPTTQELVKKTIEILNLNCQRLKDNRLEVLKRYNQQVAKYRKANDRQGLKKLAQRWFSKPWPSYFATRRALLGKHAEAYLNQIHYNG